MNRAIQNGSAIRLIAKSRLAWGDGVTSNRAIAIAAVIATASDAARARLVTYSRGRGIDGDGNISACIAGRTVL